MVRKPPLHFHSGLGEPLAWLSLAANTLAAVAPLGAAFVVVFTWSRPSAGCGKGPETSVLTGINMEQGVHRESRAPGACQRGLILHPWKTRAKGPTLHRPRRAAFHSLTKTSSAGPLSGAAVRPLLRLPGPPRAKGAFVSLLSLFIPSFRHTWPFSALVGRRCPPVGGRRLLRYCSG